MTDPNKTAATRLSLPTIDRSAWMVTVGASAAYVLSALIAIFTAENNHAERVFPGLVPIAVVILAGVLAFTTRRRGTFPLLIVAAVAGYAWRALYFYEELSGSPQFFVPGYAFLEYEVHPGLLADIGFYLVLVAAVAAGVASRHLPKPASAQRGEHASDRLSVFAVLSLVLSFVLAPVGVILGHIAIAEIRRTGERGRRLAIAGLIIGYAWTAGIVVIVIVAALGR